MNNQQQQHHGPSPPQGQVPQGQYQSTHTPNAQTQLNSSQYAQQQNPPQQYQTSQQAYQDHQQYNQYQPGAYQYPPPQQYQPQTAPTFRSQTQPNYHASQPAQQQPVSSTGQTTSVGVMPRSNTPGQAGTPTCSSSNQIAPGGAPARQYINETVAPYLLEGMKMLVREQPKDPLRVLGEWLIEQHSRMSESEVL